MRRALFLLLLFVVACARKPPPAPAVDAGAPPPAIDLTLIPRAEDRRKAQEIPEEVRASRDVQARRRAARALARIADEASVPGLLRALGDEDPETAAWGAYGLGATCKGRETSHVSALALRLGGVPAPAAIPARGAVDPALAALRALGKCGTESAEKTLVLHLKKGPDPVREAAAYALGDIASSRKQLGDETQTALLDAAPFDAALFPFGRLDKAGDAFADRVLKASRAALGRRSEARIFAVRALGRVDGAADLGKVVADRSFTAAERGEAARALKRLGMEGRLAASEALAALVTEKEPLPVSSLLGSEHGVLLELLGATGDGPIKKKGEKSALLLAQTSVPPGATPGLGRRVAELRCAAAAALADEALVDRCDPDRGEPYERARLAVMVRRPMGKNAWLAFARSKLPRVREAALEAIADHAELGETARLAIAEALGTTIPGVVTVAAEQVHAHPERFFVLAESEKKNALDPNAPPPTAEPSREVDPRVVKSLKAALAHAWTEDLVETKVALLDAAIALQLKEARDLAMKSCKSQNPTIRARAMKALAQIADGTPACEKEEPGPPAPEVDARPARAKVTLVTDTGELAIHFEPELAPIAVTRLVALAKSGFYKNVVVHRVVPGFVAQLGDPGGDGYGGSGKLLRCETSPVPFGPLDVGIALAGRDTGSSQIFVTLARYPHLDGEYTRVGRAEGRWQDVAQGDVIRDVRVEEY